MTTPTPVAQGGNDGASSGVIEDGTGTGAGNGNDQGNGALSGNVNPDGTQQPTPPALTVSQADYDRLKAQLQAADQNRQKAQDELKQIRDKDMPALEKAQRDIAEATARAEKAEADLKQSRLEKAFLENSEYKWKNPKTALKLADLSKVEVDDEGEVHNLKSALEALAKSDPYLLNSDDDEDKGGKGSTGALGTGGKGNQKPDAIKTLSSRIPALRTRGLG